MTPAAGLRRFARELREFRAHGAPMKAAERRTRRVIYAKTLSVMFAYIFLTWFIHRVFMSRHVSDTQLSLALAFTLQQVIAIFTLLGISFVVKFARYWRVRRSVQLYPQIRETLTLHLTVADEREVLHRIRKRQRWALEQCLIQMLAAVNGAGRERLAQIAEEFGLVRKWRKACRSRSAKRRREALARLGVLESPRQRELLLSALDDPDDLVKVEAARSLVRLGDSGVVEAVFDMALGQNLLVRVILTEALRPHARELCRTAVPQALTTQDSKRLVAALEMLRAWGRSAVIPGLIPMLSHSSGAVRAAALQLLPQAEITPECEQQIWRALEDGDPEVRAAAATVCGRMKLDSTLLLLKRSLHSGGTKAVVASAYALAEMGSRGHALLESEVVAGSSFPAAAALEALERVKLNRRSNVGM
jgi:HEAT repeat protein